MAVILCKNAGFMRHYRGRHPHQLRHVTFLRLLYPVKHNHLGLFLINLCPDFPELLFKKVCLWQGACPMRCQALFYTPCQRCQLHCSAIGIVYPSTPWCFLSIVSIFGWHREIFCGKCGNFASDTFPHLKCWYSKWAVWHILLDGALLCNVGEENIVVITK